MSNPIEALLSQILLELKEHHAYIRERDTRLDQDDERLESQRQEAARKADEMLRLGRTMAEGIGIPFPKKPPQ